MPTEQIAAVRRFNRMVTQRAGALEDHFLGRDRPLGESRMLFEIGAQGADLRDLRARLDLDSGYLSRLVQSLTAAGLVKLSTGDADERVRRAELTPVGHAEFQEMERRSDSKAASMLAPLTDAQRERLVAAMIEVHRLLRLSGVQIDCVDPASREARWCVAQYFAEIARRFEQGYDPARSLPTADADFRRPLGAFLVATADGEPIACGSVKTFAPRVGYLKRMWVSESARGLGLGSRMLGALENEARALGMTKLLLETNRALVEAIGLYGRMGYVEVPPFNDEPYAHHWFEKRLVE